ncbi:Heat-inducible transcription repressor HrcA [Dissostichus eleginoides]|uniref:Heat-inducible transcription repressor HrcA n=1 Tax=Dissostichus eleginoides TaxID=100907 RepID=A0AAD9F636_DISEL|nr:Heat-inducible transcription repressor HrcA [Dissostichus eleginoides]
MVPLSPSPIWPSHLSHPSIYCRASCLPVSLLQPLTLQWSQASMAVAQRAERVPSGAGEAKERREVDREEDSDTPDCLGVLGQQTPPRRVDAATRVPAPLFDVYTPPRDRRVAQPGEEE